jgi:hypothetical protein
MTEVEWLSCANPEPMLAFIQGKVSERKLRLFAVACCRKAWRLIPELPFRITVEESERLADGLTSAEAVAAAYTTAWNALSRINHTGYARDDAVTEACWATVYAASTPLAYPRLGDIASNRYDPSYMAAAAAAHAATAAALSGRARPDYLACRKADCTTLRDIVDPRFRPVAIDPVWLQWNWGTVPAIARKVYEERAFDDLPILADALTDAGCDIQEMIDHCRSSGPHVRGCWVVDLLLGRE